MEGRAYQLLVSWTQAFPDKSPTDPSQDCCQHPEHGCCQQETEKRRLSPRRCGKLSNLASALPRYVDRQTPKPPRSRGGVSTSIAKTDSPRSARTAGELKPTSKQAAKRWVHSFERWSLSEQNVKKQDGKILHISASDTKDQKIETHSTVSGGAWPCTCREKFGPRPIFKNFLARQIRIKAGPPPPPPLRLF